MATRDSSLIRHLAVVLFLAVMAAVAELTSQHEIVFPEAGALCIGLWLMPKSVWNARIRQVPILLTAASLIGVGVNLFLPLPFEIRFAIAFGLVALMLRLLRCNMYPVISAAMLPVLLGTTSWVYPVSVLAISLILSGGRLFFPQTEREEYHPFGLVHWLKLAGALCLFLAVLSWNSSLRYCMVPPLVVTMIEFANRKSGFRERPWTIWGLIVAAAVIGTASELIFHEMLGLPMVLGTLVSVTVMLLLFRRFKPFAPALAITLVPMILPAEALPWFPLFAAFGSAYFILAGMLCSSQRFAKGK